jgi:hypothetical protein
VVIRCGEVGRQLPSEKIVCAHDSNRHYATENRIRLPKKAFERMTDVPTSTSR